MKNRTLKRLSISALALTLGASPANAEELDLGKWIQRAATALPHSPTLATLTRSAEAAKSSQTNALEQSPWTVRSTLAHSQQFPRNGVTFVPRLGQSIPTARSFDITLSGGVEYRRRNRLSLALEGSTGYFDNNDDPGIRQNDIPFTVDMSVAYDVVRGGSDSAENDVARATALVGLESKLGTDASRLEAELRYLAQIINIYGIKCKLQRVEQIVEETKKAVEAAKIQRDTRVISEADYLNFKFFDDNVASRKAGLQLEYQTALQEMLEWGPKTHSELSKLWAGSVVCPIDYDGAVKRADEAKLSVEQIKRLAEGLPAYAAGRASELSAMYVFRASKTQQKVSLAPFLLGRFARTIGVDEEVGAVEVGLQFEWNVPQAKGAAAQQAAQFNYEASTQRLAEIYVANLALVRSLIARIRSETSLLRVVRNTIEHSDKLTKILEIQRTIGDVSSLNQATALANKVDVKLAFVDSWLRLELALYQLQAMQAAADQTSEAQEKLRNREWTD